MKKATWLGPYRFSPEEHERELLAIVEGIEALPGMDSSSLHRILVKYPKNGKGFFSKSEIIRGYRYLAKRHGWSGDPDAFIEKLRMKPVRTLSGVTPVTVLTHPYPCPGRCCFCPNDVRMPKSYLAREPGAQRAAYHGFDPYQQTVSRFRSLDFMGHPIDKIELIILGGTWSSYPASYQIGFVRRLFEAMNDFGQRREALASAGAAEGNQSFLVDPDEIPSAGSYNERVSRWLGPIDTGGDSTLEDLTEAHRVNETSPVRCVGLSVETRPDHVTEEEVVRIRRLGATKVQIGYQSLSDEILALNQRGHGVADSRRATRLLRQAGFKIQAHWMPNLCGSTVKRDIEDFETMFSDRDFRPDELKVYPCSLIEGTKLMDEYEAGRWRPYTREELLDVLTECMRRVPSFCRVSRVIRDIPSEDILAGNKESHFRTIAEAELKKRGWTCLDIRSREIRSERIPAEDLSLKEIRYETSIGEEVFLQFVSEDDRLVGFLRLSLPAEESFIDELRGAALIREVHVYGAAVGLGRREEAKPQHAGLGKALIARAEELARQGGYRDLAVISSVGTREYYRRLGFLDGELYQHRSL